MLRRAPARAHWPRVQAAHSLGVSAQASCDGPHLPPIRDFLSPRQAARSESASHSAGSGQLSRSVHAPTGPPVHDSLTPRRAAGQGAHSVGQGLTVTAAPTSDQHTPVCHRTDTDLRGRLPTVRLRLLCRPASARRRPPLRVAVFPRWAAGPGAHSVGQGLAETAAPGQPPTPIFPVYHQSPGTGRPQCQPRAKRDGCAYIRTVAHPLLAGPQGRAPTVSAKG